jgi:hypothetical protein
MIFRVQYPCRSISTVVVLVTRDRGLGPSCVLASWDRRLDTLVCPPPPNPVGIPGSDRPLSLSGISEAVLQGEPRHCIHQIGEEGRLVALPG